MATQKGGQKAAGAKATSSARSAGPDGEQGRRNSMRTSVGGRSTSPSAADKRSGRAGTSSSTATGRSLGPKSSKKSGASRSKSSAKKSSSSSSKPKTHVRLRGRFRPGTQVRLHEASGPDQLRPTGDPVDEQTVDKHGTVTFTKGVSEGGRYFVSGYHDGVPLDVRATGRKVGDSEGSVAQPPVQADEVRTYAQSRPFPDRGQRLPDPEPVKPVEE